MEPLLLVGLGIVLGAALGASIASSLGEEKLQDRVSVLKKEQADREKVVKQECADRIAKITKAAEEKLQSRVNAVTQACADRMKKTAKKANEKLAMAKAYHARREDWLKDAQGFYAELDEGFLRGRQWLAEAFGELVERRWFEVEDWLLRKPNPAIKAAEEVAKLRAELKHAVREQKLLEMQMKSYEEYFPQLRDYRDVILNETLDLRTGSLDTIENADPALTQGLLSPEEYEKLSTTEKYQRALDRYWGRRKSNVEIGRVYERMVGYLYEQDGWKVEYRGILQGLEDFGRDLICYKGDEIHIVQCKCWAEEKLIREKHIFQLFGTTVMFVLSNSSHVQQRTLFEMNKPNVTAVFVTKSNLSDEASKVARHLGVRVRKEDLRRYPMIKCNINQRTNERIYHLPFDQQYDRVGIDPSLDEFYAESIEQAEKAKFRRAFRWSGEVRT